MATDTLNDVEVIDLGLVNKAGGPTYQANDDELVVRYLTTGTLSATYYSSSSALRREALDLFARVAWHDPEFLAQAIVYGRNKGLMRTAPIIALAVLSTVPNKVPFKKIFSRVIRTMGDLQEFAMLVRGGLETEVASEIYPYTTTAKIRLRGTGRAVRETMARRIAEFSTEPYQFYKYFSSSSDSKVIAGRDLYRIVHPKYVTGSPAAAIAEYYVKGSYASGLPSGFAIFEDFKRLAASAEHFDDALEAIDKGRLPWDISTGSFGKLSEEQNRRLWSKMLFEMPYMALLRNLRNLVKHGVFEDRAHLDYAVSVLTNPERVAKSKQFPHAFYSAYLALLNGSETPTGAVYTLAQALKIALDLSVVNVPNLGTALVSCDVSGSMGTNIVPLDTRTAAYRSPNPLRYGDIAHILGASCYKRNAGTTHLVDFDTQVYDRTQTVKRDQPVLDMVHALSKFPGGGTSLWLPFDYALRRTDVTYDSIVAATDSESWAGELAGVHSRWNYRTSTATLIERYRQERNPKLKVFLFQLAPTYAQQTPPEMPGVYYIAGWSSNTLDYMRNIIEEGAASLDNVRAVVI